MRGDGKHFRASVKVNGGTTVTELMAAIVGAEKVQGDEPLEAGTYLINARLDLQRLGD